MRGLQRSSIAIVTALLVTCSVCVARADEPAEPKVSGENNADAARKELAESVKRHYVEGNKLVGQGRLDDAMRELEQALSLLQKLYPPEDFPHGNRDLAATFLFIGAVAQAANRLELAVQWLEKAVSAFRQLYPPVQFPDGHIDLYTAITSLGRALQARADLEGAQLQFEE